MGDHDINISFADRVRDWLFHLDRILRGEATRPDKIRNAEIRIPILGITGTIVMLAIAYGFCMAVFAMVHGYESGELSRSLQQTFATMLKVPLLFLLTLGITFPSLYVFNALVGSQLKMFQVLKLLVASLAVNLSVLASMGPIIAFFSVSTPNYGFIVLLNVVVFAVAGFLGLSFLVQTLNRLSISTESYQSPVASTQPHSISHIVSGREDESIDVVEARLDDQGPLDAAEGVVLGKHERKVFVCLSLIHI